MQTLRCLSEQYGKHVAGDVLCWLVYLATIDIVCSGSNYALSHLNKQCCPLATCMSVAGKSCNKSHVCFQECVESYVVYARPSDSVVQDVETTPTNLVGDFAWCTCAFPRRLLQADLAAHQPVKLLNEPGKVQAGVAVHAKDLCRSQCE
jgi:hypothetical protein